MQKLEASACSPLTVYTTSMVKAENNHVYAVRCKVGFYVVIKVTNVDNDGYVEFMTREAVVDIYELPFSDYYGVDTVYGHVNGYRIYPTRWSSDSKQVVFIKYSSSGFSGGDAIYTISKNGEKPKFVKKGSK